MSIFHKIAAYGLAVFLMGPSFKIMFDLGDATAYFLPFGIFAAFCLIGNVIAINRIVPRIRVAFVFLLLMGGPVYAFYLTGGVEVQLLSIFMLNCMAGILVVIYPWDERALNSLLQGLAIIGCIMSVYTMVFLGSDEAIAELERDVTGKYLTTTFTMGVGVISATYFLVKRFNPITIGIFALNWLGVALGRGRGAFLFCVLISILYLLVALNSRIANFSRAKKTIMFALILSFIPIVFMQAMQLTRMREGLIRILFSPEVEADVGGRGSAFSQGLARFYESPVLGNGLGAYADNQFGHPHNFPMTWAVDGGMVSMTFLALFYLTIAGLFFRSVSLSNQNNINVVYAMGALCAYMLLNLMKSYDPYIAREVYLMSAFPLAAYVAVVNSRSHSGSRRRRRRISRSSGLPLESG